MSVRTSACFLVLRANNLLRGDTHVLRNAIYVPEIKNQALLRKSFARSAKHFPRRHERRNGEFQKNSCIFIRGMYITRLCHRRNDSAAGKN